ncbi:MAG: hypothetical protein RO257_05180 [Candidatus Kapabacteria bacterium]|nr:hypothetical protein [Candidatus Kapabacteria bacterium]
MNEIRQTLFVKNHKVRIDLPIDFNYKQVNVIITPYENNCRFSFENPDFVPINLKNINPNYSTSILREDRDLR